MIAEPTGLSDAALDELLADASAAEAEGRIEDALASLTIAVAELVERNQVFQYPFEWLARLQCELGDFASAERSLLVGRAIAEQAAHAAGVFRMDVARARVAVAAADHGRAAALLAELGGDGEPLGLPTTERIAEIAAWLAALRFAERTERTVAVLQAEAALAIAELWAEQGKYRSALQLVDRLAAPIATAGAAIRGEQVELLRIEWLLAAGELAEAGRRLAQIAPGDGVDAIRLAVVRARTALLAGRLAQALRELDILDRAPVTEPRLFASATALRVALQCELNLLDAAEATAAAAIAKLETDPGAQPLLALLDRARRGAALRRRSAIALWELPALIPGAASAPGESGRIDLELPPEASSSFAAVWTTAANRVLIALEAGDVAVALARHRELAEVTRGVESSYIAARVRLSAALVEQHRAPGESTVRELLDIAGQLGAIGARQDAAQAMRFAAWTSARLGRVVDYAAFARCAGDLIDEIAAELDPASRTLYLMNKWNGRDEFVAGRMKQLFTGSEPFPRASRRAILRAFHDVDALTRWPIDEAFGDEQATRLAGNATSDMVMQWVAERLSPAGKRVRSGGFALRSTLGLWWFPARTLVLHYHVLADRSYVFRIARGHLDVRLLPVGRVQLRLDMRRALDDRAQLAWLASQLGITDAVARFPGIRRLVVIPHDAVANVPFAALPVGDELLCERVAISQLDRLSRLRRGRSRGPVDRLITVGLSDYAGSRYPDLPATEVEARTVADALGAGTTQALVGPAASCERVREALPGATHLHIAAHGAFDPMRPADSGVVLRERGGHATLTLHELRRIDLRRMRLATLATCRSAESAQLPGRERICLPTALLDAGARGVIASLWPVEDAPSVSIMRGFYERLRGEPPATALARVQADRRRTEPARNWAGLVFYGNE
jgi:CHAT domain